MNPLRFVPGSEIGGVVTFTVLSEGIPVPGKISFNSILVSKDVNKITYAQLLILDGSASAETFEVSSSDLFTPGKKIRILAGYNSIEKKIFEGIVVRHSIMHKRDKPSLLTIECKDEAVKLTVGRKNRYFTNKDNPITDSEAIEEILKEKKLESDVEPTTVSHSRLIQYYSTDWDFIVSRAEVNSRVVLVNDGKITVKKPTLSASPALSLTYGDTIYEFRAGIDARTQFKDVLGRSWDPAQNLVINEESDEELLNMPEQGSLSSDELAEVIDLDHYLMQHSGNIPNSELKAWADAKMLKSRLAKIRGEIKFQGSNAVKPGDTLRLSGMGNKFNGLSYVSGVRHEFYDGNWYTTAKLGLDFEWFAEEHELDDKPSAAMLPAVTGLQIGVVTKIEGDPASNDRILVRIPVVNEDAEGIWARVLRPDAGNNRGVVFRPDIGDEVVIGFLNDDPRDPVLLGALNSSKNPAPIAASDNNYEKGIVTKSGLKFLFNDEKKEVLLETPGERKFFLSDDKDSINIEDKHGNKIVMDRNGILIETKNSFSVKADKNISSDAENITQKGKTVSSQGTNSAEISSGTQTIIKGAKVLINS